MLLDCRSVNQDQAHPFTRITVRLDIGETLALRGPSPGLDPRQGQPLTAARHAGPRSGWLLKVSARRLPGRCPGLQPQVSEDPIYHRCHPGWPQ